VWRCVLGVAPLKDAARQSQLIRSVARDLPNQRVILVDTERTRVDLEEFRTPQTHDAVVSLLTWYCKSRHTRYKQGGRGVHVCAPCPARTLTSAHACLLVVDVQA
jgi:hypothetical protein